MNDKQYRGQLALTTPGTSKDGTERSGITVSSPSRAYLAELVEVRLSLGYATVILRGRTGNEVLFLAVPISEQPIVQEG